MKQDKTAIGLWVDNPLHRRLIADALAAGGLAGAVAVASDAGSCPFLVADGTLPADLAEKRRMDGLETVMLADAARHNGLIRLGGLLSRLLVSVGAGARRAKTGTIIFGPFSLDLARMVLADSRDGRAIMLTEKERDIVMRLHQAGGETLDRKRLLDDVWGYAEDAETHTIETHMYRLRQKLEADPGDPRFLVTRDNGYRLVL